MKQIRKKGSDHGSMLLDAVFALFVFTLGFTALYGLTVGAFHETQQAISLTKAANLAAAKVEALSVQPTIENLQGKGYNLGESATGKEDRFSWIVTPSWEIEDALIRIEIIINWQEKNSTQEYTLETLLKVY